MIGVTVLGPLLVICSPACMVTVFCIIALYTRSGLMGGGTAVLLIFESNTSDEFGCSCQCGSITSRSRDKLLQYCSNRGTTTSCRCCRSHSKSVVRMCAKENYLKLYGLYGLCRIAACRSPDRVELTNSFTTRVGGSGKPLVMLPCKIAWISSFGFGNCWFGMVKRSILFHQLLYKHRW